jgi:hypothetical protein
LQEFYDTHMHTYLPMSPISAGSSSALLRFIGSVVTCHYSQQTIIIIIIMNLIIKMGERQMVTEQEYGMGSGWCNRLCPTHMGHSLVALFSLSVSIKDHPLHGPWSSHRLIIPSTYLLMGAGMLVTLLSWVSSLFRPTDWRRG